jgi:pre-rRNA-processing protein TSR1
VLAPRTVLSMGCGRFGKCPDLHICRFELLFSRSIYRAERFKTSLQFVNVPYGSLYAALDTAKCADYVVFVLSPTVEVSPWGDTLLRALQAQGMPEVVAACDPSGPTDAKTRQGILKSLLSFVRYFVPEHARVLDLAAGSDRLVAARALCEGKPTEVKWREGRPWVLAESASWEDGELRMTGVVRGAMLSANRLVHLPDLGDFQISKVTIVLFIFLGE